MKSEMELFETIATERINQSEIKTQTLDQIHLPEVQTLQLEGNDDVIRFSVFGNPSEAKTLVFSTIPYSTDISDSAIGVRLAVQKEALGEEAALIGVQVYDRKHQPLNKEDKELVKSGKFTPFGRRLIRTIEQINPTDEQQVILHGFSMGADVSTEASHMAAYNQNYGTIDVSRLGVFEPARVANRSSLEVINAFSSSGKDLYKNVLASEIPAQLEARGVDLSKKTAKFKHGMQVNATVAKYFVKDLGGNMVLLKGFGHDYTKQQLGDLAKGGMPIVAGRMQESTLTPSDVYEDIENLPNVSVVEGEGDHSAADNLVRGAGMILHAAGIKPKQ